jgi:hypothetical protein
MRRLLLFVVLTSCGASAKEDPKLSALLARKIRVQEAACLRPAERRDCEEGTRIDFRRTHALGSHGALVERAYGWAHRKVPRITKRGICEIDPSECPHIEIDASAEPPCPHYDGDE